MNDKLIIEKLKELVWFLEKQCLNLPFDTDEEKQEYKTLKSELSLLEQNKGKETKEAVGSVIIPFENFLYDELAKGTITKVVYKRLIESLRSSKEVTEALEKRDHSASPTMSKDELFEGIKKFIMWFDETRYLIATDEVVREYVNSKSEE